MSTKMLITSASAIALMVSLPAWAETKVHASQKTSAENEGTGDLSTDAERAWEDIKHDASEAYEDVKAVFIDEDAKGDAKASSQQTVVINTRHTANGMIGRPVHNSQNERVGTVKDIIVDADGKASMLVIADGEFPGYDGKLVAFDYDVISRQNAQGDVIAPISEENINKAAEFSYDRNVQSDGKVRVIPGNGFSVAELLKGQLVNPEGKNVAEIDNVAFKNGRARELVVGFDKTLGLGGKQAALSYNATRLIRDGSDLDVRLTTNQAAQFEAYKKTAMKY